MKFSKFCIFLIALFPLNLELLAETDTDTLKITVTGTRTERNIDDIPASITIFDLEETRQSGKLELKDLFNYEPGVSVFDPREINYRSSAGTRGSVSSGNVNIRGLNKNRILMQRDGIRLPAGFYAVGYDYSNGNLVNYYSLSSIDVLKGPGSVLYGSDALGGVISFNSLKPEDILSENSKFKIENFLDFNGSNQGFSNTSRIAGKDINSGLSYLAVIGFNQSNEVNPNGSEKIFINDAENYTKSLYFTLDNKLNDENKIRFQFDNYQKNTNVTRAEGNLANNYISQKSKVKSKKDRYLISWDYSSKNDETFLENFKAKVFFQDHHTADMWDEILDKGFYSKPLTSDYNLYDKSYGFDLQFGSYVDNHFLTYGIDYSITENQYLQDKYTNTFGAILHSYYGTNYPIKRSPDTDTIRLGVYIQDEIKYGKFDFIAGLRFDNYKLNASADELYLDYCTSGREENECPVKSLDISEYSPKIGVVYSLNNTTDLWAQYSHGFRAPSWWEMQASQINFDENYQSIPNADLNSENSKNYEIGIRGDYLKFNYELNGYFNNYKDFIDTAVLVDPQVRVDSNGDDQTLNTYQPQNVSNARIWGIEFANKFKLYTNINEELSLVSTASYTHGQDLDDNTPLNNIDPFKIVSGIKYTNFSKKFSGELISTYVGRSRRKEDATGYWPSSYTTFDLIGRYKLKQSIDLYMGIYNLFNQKYFKSTNINVSQSSNGIAQFAEPGRHLNFGFKFIF